MTHFIPHTPEEKQAMLQAIGVGSMAELFNQVPEALKSDQRHRIHALPMEGRNEVELQQVLTQAAMKNAGATMDSFLGGGAYNRFIPPAVNTIAGRSEFYTAYTPYQPEVSQGTLQMIYEFQTIICELTGMDVGNASVYDGATAMSEAAFMAVRATRRNNLLLAQTTNPQYQRVLETYAKGMGDIQVFYFDPAMPLEPQLTVDPKTIAAVMVQQPDYFGRVQQYEAISTFCKQHKALFVVGVDPMTLGVLEPPRSYGADIVTGDIQQFGNSVNFGGPYGGFVTTTQALLRQLPGRIVGRTKDKEGTTCYTLTLQTREQHIRREKATSNICTNQSLNVLKATVYLSLVGPQGLRQLAEVSTERAHQLADGLLNLAGVTSRFDGPFLYEFALRLPVPARQVIKQMAQQHNILAGVDVGKYWPDEENTLLVAVTEMNSPESVDRYIDAFDSVLSGKSRQTVPNLEERNVMIAASGHRKEANHA